MHSFSVASENDLTGTIPTELGLLSNMDHLNLRSLYLEQGLPSELGALTRMCALSVDRTELVGTIPTEVCDLRDISLCYLVVDCPIGNGRRGLGNYSSDAAMPALKVMEGNCFSMCRRR